MSALFKKGEAKAPRGRSPRTLSMEEMIGQLFVVLVEPHGKIRDSLQSHEANHYGGIFLRRDNLQSVDRTRRFTHRFRRPTRRIPIPVVAVDEEGGLVSDLSHLTTPAPSAAALGMVDDEEVTRDVYQGIGEKARALGFNTVFAPVLDVNVEAANPVIGTRAFGAVPSLVVKHAMAALDGLHRAKVTACVKHFPGHGATSLDSHLTLPEVRPDAATLRERELAPYVEAFGRSDPPEMLMTAHVAYPALDRSGAPATLSRAVLQDLLRKDLGFQGVVITDAMEMKGITERLSPGKAAVTALDAGADLLLYAMDPAMAAAAYKGVLDAVRGGKLSEERIGQSVDRVHALRRKFRGRTWVKMDEAEEILELDHEQVFFEAARKGLVLEGNAGVLAEIPAAPGPKLVVLPHDMDEWRRVPLEVVREQLEPAGFTVLGVSPRPTAEEIGMVEGRAAEASVVVVGTASRGAMTEENRKLIEALTRRDVIKVGVALLDPRDAEQMMSANCRIKTFGFTTPQLWAMSQELLG
jgi:beta-N-acetylhexosaminidase